MSFRLTQEMSLKMSEFLARAGFSGSFEILEEREETRLKFNAPTPVRVVVVRIGTVEVELFHWLVDDEWELSGLTT